MKQKTLKLDKSDFAIFDSLQDAEVGTIIVALGAFIFRGVTVDVPPRLQPIFDKILAKQR